MSEKFALKWNDFQSNWNSSLSEWYKDTEFVDVTLISEDKVKFSAHKIILSSCSNMFKFILKENTHANQLLYLGGVSSQNIGFILDYIYYGEVKLFQEQLDCFLETAQKLEIEGLLGDEQKSENQGQCQKQENHFKQDEHDFQRTEDKTIVGIGAKAPLEQRKYSRPVTAVHVANVESMSPQEIDIKMRELYQKNDGVWSCLVCDYSTRTNSGDIRKHVKIHLDGLSYTCSLCNGKFRSTNILYNHKKKCNV